METKTCFDSRLTNKTAAPCRKDEEGDETQEVREWCQQSSRVNVSAWDETCMCTCSVCIYACCLWVAGGRLLQIQEEDIQSAFRLSLDGGPSLSCAGILAGTTSSRGDNFVSATWTQGAAQKQTSCSPEMFREGRRGKYRKRSCWAGHHIQHNQDKQNTVLHDEKKGQKAEPSDSQWVTGPVRKTWQAGRARGRHGYKRLPLIIGYFTNKPGIYGLS